MIDITTLIGVAGAGIILLFFLLNQLHKVHRDSIWYDSANALGAILLIVYSYLIGSLPFLVLNVVWAGVSLRDMYRFFAHTDKPAK